MLSGLGFVSIRELVRCSQEQKLVVLDVPMAAGVEEARLHSGINFIISFITFLLSPLSADTEGI